MIDARTHRERPWRVHTLAPDFELLDLWQVPLAGDATRGESFAEFLHAFVTASRGGRPCYSLRLRSLGDAVHAALLGAAAGLVGFRRLLGRLLRLDDEVGSRQASPGRSGSRVRARLDGSDGARERGTLPPVVGGAFETVYAFDDEALLEVANRTIHALLHLSRLDTGRGRWDVVIAVYVKSRGIGSRFYLALIKPFRHAVVYPAWIEHLVRTWAVLRPAAAPAPLA